jgi:Sec-independent protein translocase protein TatA
MAILGALALMLFGPEQLPKIARKVGHVMRDVQNTSQQFVREMERAAEDYEPPNPPPSYNFAETFPAEPAHPPIESVQPEQSSEHPPEAPGPKREPEYRVESGR